MLKSLQASIIKETQTDNYALSMFTQYDTFLKNLNITVSHKAQFSKNIQLVKAKLQKKLCISLTNEGLMNSFYLLQRRFKFFMIFVILFIFFRMENNLISKTLEHDVIYIFLGFLAIFESDIEKQHTKFVIYEVYHHFL